MSGRRSPGPKGASPRDEAADARAASRHAAHDVHRHHSGALRIDAPARQAARGHRGQADGRARRRAGRGAPARRASSSRPTTRGSRPRSRRTASPSASRAHDHATGTDRLAEAAQQLLVSPTTTIVVNVQGDEPLLSPALIRAMADLLAAHPDAAIATACHPIADPAEAFNPNVVKVVLDRRALCALLQPGDDSLGARRVRGRPRCAVASCRRGCRSTGITDSTRTASRSCAPFPTLAAAPIERFEALEQLRALWHGYPDRRRDHGGHAGAGRRHGRGPRARARAVRRRRSLIQRN